MTESITFYLDPMCPYSYQTSVWIRSVRDQLDDGLDIIWKFFSLEEVNLEPGKKHPWERPWSFGFGQMRVGTLVRRELGNEGLDRWYETVGHAFFSDGRKTHRPDVHAAVIAEAGFDPELVDRALADPTTLDEPRAEHEDAVTRYGAHGVATLILPGEYAVYGPVIVPAPRGEDALALWDLVRGMARIPHLYELRHPKTIDDLLHVGEQFETYLSTRDWQTVENPAP